MKKLVLAITAAAALSSTAFAQQSVSNADLIITGEITNASCSMKIKPIDFQSKSVREFTDNAATTGWETTAIEFSKCQLAGTGVGGSDVDSVEITVNPGTKAASTDYWANSGTASNVAIELEVNGSAVTAAGTATPLVLDLKGDKNVGVRARLVRIGTDEVTAGDINASVGITAEYK